jgi:hypothetical protein
MSAAVLLFEKSERELMVCDRREDYEQSTYRTSTVIKAKAILQKLNCGHPTVLVSASDGHLYIVKLMCGAQGPNALANEVLGNELARCLGLSVPEWRPIEISKECMDRYLMLFWPDCGSGLNRPGPGLHFGLRAVGQDAGETVYEILPANWLSKVVNRNDFLGMLLLDLWANQVGHRKAIFVSSPDNSVATAFFIDNSQMFGGFWGHEEQRRGTAMYFDRRVYAGLDVDRILNWWLQKAIPMDESTLLCLAASIPRQWHHGGYLQEVTAQLQTRKWFVARLLAQELRLISETSAGNEFSFKTSDQFSQLWVGQSLDDGQTDPPVRERRKRSRNMADSGRERPEDHST